MRRSMAAVALSSVVALGLAACSGDDGSGAAVDDDDATTAPTVPVKLPEDLDEELEALDLNDRGNVSVEPEKPAEFMDVESGTVFATIAAREVETDFKCTAPDALESINGQFVAITFDMDLTDEFADSGFPSLNFTVHEFRAWDAEGVRVADPVGTAEACVSEGDRVPTPLDPGQGATGLVILDVPEGSGSAAFVVGGFQGAYGWEWDW